MSGPFVCGERLWPAIAGMIAVGTACTSAGAPDRLPGHDLDLVLEAPIRTWDEALPLGNGLLGGLLWGEDGTLRLSLDRGDLWDNRHPPRVFEPDFTWREMKKLLKGFGYREVKTGGSSGSRSAFVHDATRHVIRLHRPHPVNVMKRYQLDLIEDELRRRGIIA